MFTALRRVISRIHYYRSAVGREVDFLALIPGGLRIFGAGLRIPCGSQDLRREAAALRDAMASQRESSIVTRDVVPGAENRIAVDSGKIEVAAAWRFLLDQAGDHPV